MIQGNLFEDYDRITDTLIYLSDNITLNFTVNLAKKAKDGSRSFFHYETEYQSKYIGTNNARAIKRLMVFYFVIDNKNDFGNGFIIRPQDAIMITKIIEDKVFPMYFGPDRVFKIIDNKLVVTNYNKILYTQSEYKFLAFEPLVCSYEDGYKDGIRITINSDYVDIDIDKFMGLYYILKNTDMYGAACSLVNYVKSAPYAVNVYSRKGLAGGGPLPDEQWNSSIDSSDLRAQQSDFLKNVKVKGSDK